MENRSRSWNRNSRRWIFCKPPGISRCHWLLIIVLLFTNVAFSKPLPDAAMVGTCSKEGNPLQKADSYEHWHSKVILDHLNPNPEIDGERPTPKTLWSINTKGERLLFHPSFWPDIDFRCGSLTITYSENVLVPSISYHHTFKEVDFHPGKSCILKKDRFAWICPSGEG